MSFEPGHILMAHHVGLPSCKEDWSDIAEFWESLGLVCRFPQVENDEYDHAGAGPRLQVFAGEQLIVSYYVFKGRRLLPRSLHRQHLGLLMAPQALHRARVHPSFERETHWDHSKTSVFLTGPYGMFIELVTVDPDYHNDHQHPHGD